MRREALPSLFRREISALHCVGVGGMGVGPLAIYLAQLGFSVSGEDDALTDAMRLQLTRAGVKITATGEVPVECELVAYSSAIAPTHPAAIVARQRNLPMVRRGELLAEVTRARKLVAVCGSHGKTTTTAMLITVLREAQFPAGYVLGGLFDEDNVPPARAGSNEWVVAEVDESDGTIERFSPTLTVAVNLDWDHPDHYRQLADLEATFRALFARTQQAVLVSDACALSGRLVENNAGERLPVRADAVNASGPVAEAAPAWRMPKSGVQTLSFGRAGDFVGLLRRETPEQTKLALSGQFALSAASLRAHGEFNVANATAALAAAQLMGARISETSLAGYPGVRRRQTVLQATPEMRVLEDYAHHPAEIRALLGSLRARLTAAEPAHLAGGRLVVIFQPHRFSRTAQFKTEFAASLTLADRVYLLDVYGAGETPIAGGTTADLYAELKRIAPALPVTYLPGDTDRLLAALSASVDLPAEPGATAEVESGEISPARTVAFVGAGDIDQAARRWLALRAEAAARMETWDAFANDLRALVSPTAKVKREESLAEKTTMRVGGAARVYCEPAGVEDLQSAVRLAQAKAVPLFLLGRGSNLLVPDEGVEGLVLNLGQAEWQRFDLRPNGRVWVGAGLRLKQLCGLAAKAGLVGFEFLEGIPGNVGGALRMNAGAMGGWMFDVVEEVQLMTFDGDVKTLKKAEMHVDYRHCAELHHAIALGALLMPASKSEGEMIKQQIDAYRDKRHKTQPREPSAGCIFKNPQGDSAGRLIDSSGLKGERVGDAEVSAVHANFIVNRGDATSADVIELVRRVRARVRETTGVILEPEVLLYGKEWRDVL